MYLGPLVYFDNTVMERSWPMPEFPVSQDQFFNLYLAFEIKVKYFISLIGYRKTLDKLEANCFFFSASEINKKKDLYDVIFRMELRSDIIFRVLGKQFDLFQDCFGIDFCACEVNELIRSRSFCPFFKVLCTFIHISY